MPIRKTSARQEVIAAILNIDFSDVTASGVAEEAIELPSNAIVVGGEIDVLTAWNSATSAALDLGDTADDDRYTATPIDLKVAGRTALTLTGYKHTVLEQLKTLITTVGVSSAGKARIVLLYIREGRAAFAQGGDYRGAGIPLA